jgi:hypothetical protein
MAIDPTPTPRPKRRKLFNKRNRSAWILSFILIVMMVLRLAAGFRQPPTVHQADNQPAIVATP